jgi:hypothetical protein
VVVVAVVLLVVGVLVIPSWRRARSSPGEQGGLGDVRGWMSAQEAYARANGGYYDEPACLAAPRQCVRDYPPNGPAFVDSATAGLRPRLGYSFAFHRGPRAPLTAVQKEKLSPSSLVSFAVVALPAEPGGALKAFCGDSSGRVCARRDGQMSDVREGRCPDSCDTLR